MSAHAAAERAIRQNPVVVYGADGRAAASHMKLLSIELAVARRSAKYNRIGLFLPDTEVQEGDRVEVGGDSYLVGNLSADVHRGRTIRLAAELIWCSHLFCQFHRPTLLRNVAGSAVGEGEPALVASNVALLFTTSDLFVEGARDVDVGYWNAYVSRHVPQLQAEDYVVVDGRQYEVKWYKNEMQGVTTYRVMKRTR